MRKYYLLVVVVFFLMLANTAIADFVEVRRAVSVRVNPETGADVVFKAEAGTNLHLLESETNKGFYHVQDPQSGAEGWIFRSFVRRFPGDIPASAGEGGVAIGGGAFPVNKCKPPYNEDPSPGLAIEACGAHGDSPSNSGEFVQNPHKNELCGSGALEDVHITDLLNLQHEVDDSGMPFGSSFGGGSGPPKDRSPLTNLPALPNGLKLEEGDLVSFVGFLSEAHYMPKSESVPKKGKGGESVNCHSTQHSMADIHLALSNVSGRITAKDPQKQQKTCNTISAEMIPHLRPEVWNIDNLNEVIDLERPVRITGQVFFDASHEPCRDGKIKSGNPLRISGWEIHPLYTFEVCKFADIKKCPSNTKTVWQPLSRADGVEISDDEQNP